MNFETKLLNKLKSYQAQYASEALRMPGDKSAYDFGYRVGHYAGIEKAVSCLLAAIEDDKFNEPDL